MSATDEDGRDNEITYSLSGVDADNFTIDQTGVITHTVLFSEVTTENVSKCSVLYIKC